MSKLNWLLAALLAMPGLPCAPGVSWDAADGPPAGAVGARIEPIWGRAALVLEPESGVAWLGETPGDGADSLTLLAVAYLERPADGFQGILARDRHGGPTGDVYSLLLDPAGNLTGRLVGPQGTAQLQAPVGVGWHQLALSWDGARARLYLDGKEVAAQPFGGKLAVEPETPLALGGYSNGPGRLRGGVALAEVHTVSLDGDAIAEQWAAWQAAHPVDDTFSFAQASDIHITDTRSVELINDAVDRINGDPSLAFSLWLGDLTQLGTPDQMVLARLALDRLSRPRYTVRGNHDQREGVYEQEFGPLHQTFTHAGWKFLLLDSNPGDETPLADAEVAWLKEQLAATPRETPLVLCTHHPLMPGTKAYRLAGADEVLALFEGYNLKAVLAGHFHGNQETVVDGVLYTTTACLATTRTNHDGTAAKGYRLFHVADGGITTEFVPMPAPKE